MKSNKHRGSRGFTLVATLMLMVLITLVAAAMLGMASIEMRKSGAGSAMMQARANARMALLLAIGEVQKNLGPDQRVAADARVTAGASATPAHPHWLSVWKTTRADGSPWITRDAMEGGLSDERVKAGWQPAKERIASLVSGNETAIVHQEDDGANPALVRLSGTRGTGGTASADDIVRVPKVAIQSGSTTRGAYAWWVSDLGTKANVATRRLSAKRDNGATVERMISQDLSWKAFGDRDIPDDQRAKLAGENQLALAQPGSGKPPIHEVTVWSAGLPVDARDGGWKRDLTAYLESDGSVADLKQGEVVLRGVRDSDNLIGPQHEAADADSAFPGQAARFSDVSPNFGLLRSWSRRALAALPGNHTATSELAEMAGKATGGGNSRSVDFRNRTTTHLMPVITEGSLYYNLSAYAMVPAQARNPYGMRVHYYPRVALWNPYNFPLKVPESAVFLHINGSKSVEVTMEGGRTQRYRMYWGRGGSKTGGSVRGSMYFKLDAATLEPGETLVWSVARNSPYDEVNFANNLLTTSKAPSPARSFHQDKREDGYPLFEVIQGFPPTPGLLNNRLAARPLEWREIVPPKPAGNLQTAAWTQADDYFMSWKPMNGNHLSDASFRSLPMGRFVSCAYQYGDEDELPLEWTSSDPVPFLESTQSNPVVSMAPDRRTRDGFRLRWLEETVSNVLGGGSLAGLPHLQSAGMANWNMRASWAFRTPFENVTDVAPHFFGIYTRDLFDGDVDWNGMNPRSSGGKFQGDPFDQPVRGPGQRILFDIPRRGAEIASLGAFQHANFSEFIWHPTYPLGNSLADPRVPPLHTEPVRSIPVNRDKGGWNQDSIGYSTDGRSSNDNGSTSDIDNWAWHARDFLQQAALDQNLIYDLSYELNHALWDSCFLSSGTAEEKAAFLTSPIDKPLPNGRMRPNPLAGTIERQALTDFHRAASNLVIDGAFNVHSTSVAAWEALLLSAMGASDADGVAFPRIPQPATGGGWDGGDPRSHKAWSGQRILTRAEIRRLAVEIVAEVRRRGPFLGLSDFVNRRLRDDETGKKGALQAAIDRSGINDAFVKEWPLDNKQSLPDYRHADHIQDPTRMEQTLKPDTTAWGALGFLTQADLLQFIGPALTARSDTFRIRAYGESVDGAGKVAARAWCEAVIQRAPHYVDPGDNLLQIPRELNPVNQRFGRRFEIISFRWLAADEV